METLEICIYQNINLCETIKTDSNLTNLGISDRHHLVRLKLFDSFTVFTKVGFSSNEDYRGFGTVMSDFFDPFGTYILKGCWADD